ncbi:MAG: TonB-dependent receptor domain-containing protein [Myxococcota bacterium]
MGSTPERVPRRAACILLTLCWSFAAPEILHAQEAEPAPEEEPGGTGVVGRVVDAQTGEGIIEGQVRVVGGERVFTDIDGRFTIDLPPGRYTLRSFYEFYEPARVNDVVVRPGERTRVAIELEPESEESFTEEVEVSARADSSTVATQMQMRRESVAVRDAVSAEEISKTGDSTASSAARRVVGCSIEEDKFLVCRGLGGRWSQVLLNGVPVPNLDPDLASVELDIFPAGLLSSIAVHKSFVPDSPASFAGGTMLIGSEDFPDDFQLRVGISAGLNTETAFRDMYVYDGGGLDWLGVEDGTRQLPAIVPSDRKADTFPREGFGLSDEQLASIAKAMTNEYTPSRRPGAPNLGFNLQVGDTVELGGRPLGYLLSFNYGYEEQRATGRVTGRPIRDNDTRELVPDNDFDLERGARDILWGALGTVSYQPSDDDEIRLVSMWNQSANDTVEFQEGYFGTSDSGSLAQWTLDYVQRSLFAGQLMGEHRNLAVPPGAKLQWTFFTNWGTRREPDRRTTRYLDPSDRDAEWTFDFSQNDGFIWQDKDFSGERFWSDLTHHDIGGKGSLDFPLGPAEVKVGGWASTTRRQYEARRFKMRQKGLDRTLAPEDLFDEESLGTSDQGAFSTVEERTLDTDGYRARRDLYAAFAMGEVPLFEKLRLVGGLRVEAFAQDITVRAPVASPKLEDGEFQYVQPEDETERTDLNVLPAGSIVYEVVDDMFLRASYGMTIVRPELRELVPVRIFDFVRFREAVGNPDLDATLIHSADVRWEWFPSPSEVFAVSAFYKKFRDPIELQIIDAENQNISYANQEGANNYGVELEARIALGNLWKPLDHLTLGGNLALVKSRIDLTEDQAMFVTNTERPLQGQSPYVANLWLDYAHPDAGISLFLVYNVFGRRISEVGTRVAGGMSELPDVYQEPFHSLDLTLRWEATDHMALRLKLQNLLFEEKEFRQGGIVRERVFEGMSASVGLQMTY